MTKLEPCPFCGGKVTIADYDIYWSIIASGNEPNVSCGCRLFMESELFAKNDILAKQRAKEKLIEKWNTRKENAIKLPPHDDLIDRNEAIKHFKDLTCVYDMALKDCNLEKEVYPHIEALWRGKRAICDTVVKILSEAPVIVAATAKE